MASGDPWTDARRIEGWAGEARVNLIRLAAVLVFYAHHLLNVYVLQDDPAYAGAYHVDVTLLVLAWATAVLVLYACLSRRWVPPALKYVASAWDTVLITALLTAAGDPRNVLAVLYFLVIIAAALRLSLRLVQVTTIGTMAAYAVFLGYDRFWLDLPDEQRLPRAQQIIFLLALGAAGLLAGQMVRQARRLVRGYPVTVAERSGEESCPST
jgi:hypothetical protein